jgi:hypothetical protein
VVSTELSVVGAFTVVSMVLVFMPAVVVTAGTADALLDTSTPMAGNVVPMRA